MKRRGNKKHSSRWFPSVSVVAGAPSAIPRDLSATQRSDKAIAQLRMLRDCTHAQTSVAAEMSFTSPASGGRAARVDVPPLTYDNRLTLTVARSARSPSFETLAPRRGFFMLLLLLSMKEAHSLFACEEAAKNPVFCCLMKSTGKTVEEMGQLGLCVPPSEAPTTSPTATPTTSGPTALPTASPTWSDCGNWVAGDGVGTQEIRTGVTFPDRWSCYNYVRSNYPNANGVTYGKRSHDLMCYAEVVHEPDGRSSRLYTQ